MTRKDAQPLPRIDDTLDALGRACYFSTLNLASGYWQVEVKPGDSGKWVELELLHLEIEVHDAQIQPVHHHFIHTTYSNHTIHPTYIHKHITSYIKIIKTSKHHLPS